MKILIVGAKGMLGRTLMKGLCGDLFDGKLFGCDIEQCDISCWDSVQRFFSQESFDVVINCAAFTDVDACESSQEKAYAVNSFGPGNLATAVQICGGRLIHISTDYVFSGQSEGALHEWDETFPQTVYGHSKLGGEVAVRSQCQNHVVLRVAWLYGEGGPSFLHTMCRLGATEGEPLKVVADQHGSPTSTDALVPVVRHFIQSSQCGTFHATCEGGGTWYDFTKEIFRLKGYVREVVPCTSDEYPRPARRPSYSRLDNMALRISGIPPMPHWKEALERFLTKYPKL